MKKIPIIFLMLFIPNIILADCKDANYFVKCFDEIKEVLKNEKGL